MWYNGYHNKEMNLMRQVQILDEPLFAFHFALMPLGKAWIYLFLLLELFSLHKPTDLEERKSLNSKSEECCPWKSVVHCFTILLLSAHPKKVWSWSYTNLHHYKQIICVGSPVVHIWTVGPWYVIINGRVYHIYIYIYIYICD